MAPPNINIETILNTWTTQAGYPVVTVERQADKKKLIISQQRFLLKTKEHNDTSLWEIPLNYASPLESDHNFTSTQHLFIMPRNQKSFEVVLRNATDWIIFNVQQTGYYRVNYDNETWKNIAVALQQNDHSGIHVLNRAQVNIKYY